MFAGQGPPTDDGCRHISDNSAWVYPFGGTKVVDSSLLKGVTLSQHMRETNPQLFKPVQGSGSTSTTTFSVSNGSSRSALSSDFVPRMDPVACPLIRWYGNPPLGASVSSKTLSSLLKQIDWSMMHNAEASALRFSQITSATTSRIGNNGLALSSAMSMRPSMHHHLHSNTYSAPPRSPAAHREISVGGGTQLFEEVKQSPHMGSPEEPLVNFQLAPQAVLKDRLRSRVACWKEQQNPRAEEAPHYTIPKVVINAPALARESSDGGITASHSMSLASPSGKCFDLFVHSGQTEEDAFGGAEEGNSLPQMMMLNGRSDRSFHVRVKDDDEDEVTVAPLLAHLPSPPSTKRKSTSIDLTSISNVSSTKETREVSNSSSTGSTSVETEKSTASSRASFVVNAAGGKKSFIEKIRSLYHPPATSSSTERQ